jgi:hypothetical protein
MCCTHNKTEYIDQVLGNRVSCYFELCLGFGKGNRVIVHLSKSELDHLSFHIFV